MGEHALNCYLVDLERENKVLKRRLSQFEVMTRVVSWSAPKDLKITRMPQELLRGLLFLHYANVENLFDFLYGHLPDCDLPETGTKMVDVYMCHLRKGLRRDFDIEIKLRGQQRDFYLEKKDRDFLIIQGMTDNDVSKDRKAVLALVDEFICRGAV